MRLARTGLRVVAGGVISVAVGVSVNQALNGGQWNARWLIAAVALAAAAEVANRWLGRDGVGGSGGVARPALWPCLAGGDGVPLLLGDVTLRDLGVHASRFGGVDGPYISRGKADDALAAALADGGGVVIVEGPRLAGATRTLARAAQALLPNYLAAGFTDDPRVLLKDMIAQADRWADGAGDRATGVVAWLDGLSAGRLAELALLLPDGLPAGVRVLATCDSAELEGLRGPEQVTALLEEHATRVRLGSVTADERRELLAAGAYAVLRPVLEDGQQEVLLGRLMVAWEPLRTALSLGSGEQAAPRVALLRAVTDWHRVGLPRLLSRKILKDLYRAYRRDLAGAAPGSPVSATGLSEALQWASAASDGARPRLVDLQDLSEGQQYTPYPLLAVIADDPGEEVSWPVSDVLWDYADRSFDGTQRRDIGYTALSRGARHAAARLISHPDAPPSPEACHRLGHLFSEHADWDDSRYWWQQAAAAGHHDDAVIAMVHLGLLEQQQGNPDVARHWYQQAIATAHHDHAPWAMVNLGILELEQGNPDLARHWWSQAIDTGHQDQAPEAMVDFGLLEQQQGNPDVARHWYQQAIDTGHQDQAPRAMTGLGILENEQGNLDLTRDCYQRAVATGHHEWASAAMVNLGFLEDEQGNRDLASQWWQQAAATAHGDHAPTAMQRLGVLEKEQGNLDLARHWYQQAIDTGHHDMAPKAMVGLGFLEEEQGNLAQARRWWQQAAATGHHYWTPGSMARLGILEEEQGNLDLARHWYQQAIATGHPYYAPSVMVSLGNLEAQHGDPDVARHWYQQAINTVGNDDTPKAMLNLGGLEYRQGNPDLARHWWHRAIATGDPEITARAQSELRTLDQREHDRQEAERFGRYGYLAYADPALMNRDNRATQVPQAATDPDILGDTSGQDNANP
jgi:Tfp pilus assembly protein PilF